MIDLEKILLFSGALLLGLIGIVHAEALSDEYQQDLIERLMFVSGSGPLPASMAEGYHWCGTAIALEANAVRPNMNRQFRSLAMSLQARPTYLPETHASPGGYFLLHYTTTGFNAVYQANIDTLNGGDGVPDFVNQIAMIADSVWMKTIDDLGFPVPPPDGFYPEGGDNRYDIYIRVLGPSIFGMTTPEVPVSNMSITSFMEINTDYRIGPYVTKPLDAVRVTLAHEFFHAVQFGMDFTEFYETDDGMKLFFWWEMSAVWMEEQLYDHVNDYYFYIPFYFELPWKSFQWSFGLHQYGAGIFPIFLSEKWGTDIIFDIWNRCQYYGEGPDFLQAADDAIAASSGGQYDLRMAFQEFTIWNFLTGKRQGRAPEGWGFSEGADYPGLSESVFLIHTAYRVVMSQRDIPHEPENLAANYIDFRVLGALPDDTFKVVVVDDINQTNEVDWNVSFVKFPRDTMAPLEIDMYVHPRNQVVSYTVGDSTEYRNAVMIPVPVSALEDAYPGAYEYGYSVLQYTGKNPTRLFDPYSNPIIVTQSRDHVTFRARARTDSSLAKEAYLIVTLFTVAGEQVREVRSAPDYFEDIAVNWYFDNESGREVSGGVYLALYRLVFLDGTSEVTGKFKVAVLK
ncbi:MAG: hypothetical protein JSV44_09410 [Candidatus Zixiibacteriota bacterium]|nr:MAG: hypothetical protein JSV44_09410 [candidate division Zixibacteria bacterium]